MKNMHKLIYILLIAGICSCSTKKLSTEKRQVFHLDSLVKVRKDSIEINDFRQSLLHYSTSLKHYRLSPPDSVGIQYIQTITIAKIDQTENQSGVRQENRNASEVIEQISQKSISDEIYIQKINQERRWMPYVILILVVGFILIRRFNIHKK